MNKDKQLETGSYYINDIKVDVETFKNLLLENIKKEKRDMVCPSNYMNYIVAPYLIAISDLMCGYPVIYNGKRFKACL